MQEKEANYIHFKMTLLHYVSVIHLLYLLWYLPWSLLQ